MNETKDEPTAREGSMTPPDPVEEKLRKLACILRDSDEGETWGLTTLAATSFLEAAGIPTLLADTQSKDKRIAELEGLLRRLKWYVEAYSGECDPGSVGRRTAITDDLAIDAALAGTGVASDGGEDGE